MVQTDLYFGDYFKKNVKKDYEVPEVKDIGKSSKFIDLNAGIKYSENRRRT